MIVGFLKDNYPEQRCIINKVGGGNVSYKLCDERLAKSRIIGKVKRTLTRKSAGWDWMLYDPVIPPSVDFIHTFNHVCDTRIPWAACFESTIPRTNQTVNRFWENEQSSFRPDSFTRRSIDLMLQDSCKALIAISNSAFIIQKNMLNMLEYEGVQEISNKMCAIHPPQDVLVDQEFIAEKFQNLNRYEFIFLGRDFFRKGCDAFIETLIKYQNDVHFHLTIISELGWMDYASETDKKKWEHKLASIPWITWYRSLENRDCLELIKHAHIGVLTTLQDTYGYSTLEMQACGCPVISTNIRACSEINNDNCGWIVPLKKDNIGGEALRRTVEERERCDYELRTGIELSLNNIFNAKPEDLQKKAIQGIARIRIEHDPVEYGQQLKKIYGLE